MRTGIATVMALSLGFGGVITPRTATAAAVAAAEASPQELYQEGRTAYRLGKYEDAVNLWERAYAGSQNALILFNIGLAYRGWFSISRDVAHLRRARSVFQNFVLEVQADSSLGDPGEAEAQIRELDAMIAKEEGRGPKKPIAKAPTSDPGATSSKAPAATTPIENQPESPEGTPQTDPQTGEPIADSGPGDTGAKRSKAPVILMGVGGGVAAAGLGVAIGFIAKAVGFNDEIDTIDDDFLNRCRGGVATAPLQALPSCQQYQSERDRVENNGALANTYQAVGWGIAALGAATLTAGIVLHVKGKKKTAANTAWQIVPTRRGLALTGRF